MILCGGNWTSTKHTYGIYFEISGTESETCTCSDASKHSILFFVFFFLLFSFKEKLKIKETNDSGIKKNECARNNQPLRMYSGKKRKKMMTLDFSFVQYLKWSHNKTFDRNILLEQSHPLKYANGQIDRRVKITHIVPLNYLFYFSRKSMTKDLNHLVAQLMHVMDVIVFNFLRMQWMSTHRSIHLFI